MNALMNFLQKRVVPASNKFASLSFMVVLRNAVSTIIPLMVVGAIGTFLANIPFEGIANLLAPAVPFFNAIATVTSNICGLVIAAAIGYFAAQHYDLDGFFGIVTSLACFFAASLTDELTIDTSVFGASGIFTAIIIGFISIYISYLCKKYHIEIKMPSSVPPMVSVSFSVILSMAISVTLILLIRIGLNVNINDSITWLLSPIANGLGTLPGLLIYSFFGSLLFICGINPAVIFGFLVPIMSLSYEANAAAMASGQLPTHFVTWGMYTIMCCGGTGSTLGLTILTVFSKSKAYKTLGRISIVPSFFNINEPMIYGFPVMFNPILLVPFIIVPMINIASTWFLMSANIIGRAYVDLPWSTPPIFNGFFMSGGDIRTAIWTGCLILISVVCYYPFFKVAEKGEIAREKEAEEAEAVTA